MPPCTCREFCDPISDRPVPLRRFSTSYVQRRLQDTKNFLAKDPSWIAGEWNVAWLEGELERRSAA